MTSILMFAVLFAPPAACKSLQALQLPHATITVAQIVDRGAFVVPVPAGTDGAGSPETFKGLPAFCRVMGVLAPTADSHIEFEVWLPTSGWNGRYLAVGNGGFAGYITYAFPASLPDVPALADALRMGFAASSTDTGHKGANTDASWAKGHPEKATDYYYRGIHETAETAKTIIRAFYGDNPRYSYFDSCSNGGRQALMEVQRYPADYDGVLAGAPAYAYTRIYAAAIWVSQALAEEPGSYIPSTKLPAIEAAALAACDARDGLKDGLISNPAQCHFDPAVLLCKESDQASCLTAPQVTALKEIYAGPTNSKGEQIIPGYLPGGETGGTQNWAAWITGTGPGKGSLTIRAESFLENVVDPDLHMNIENFNFDRDVKKLDDSPEKPGNATDPNLKPFENHGGKLIMYHGWSDPALPPLSTVDYYNKVTKTIGAKDATNFIRLYMTPGVQHCGGGPGPNVFGEDLLGALQQWVEKGVVPDHITATKFKNDDPANGVARTRPLCPYPQIATYKGTGSIDDAANFVCKAP